MVPRPTWRGHLRISLVSFPVRMYNAITATERVSLNQLHRECHRRLKQQMVCPEHGPVGREDIVKGYEFEKGKFVVIEEEDLQKIKLETQKTIEITQFVDQDEMNAVYMNSSYYIGPDGPVAEDAFRVMREAMKKERKIGLGRVVMAAREYVVALRPEGKGFVLTTLHAASEVRAPQEVFADIKDGEVNASHMRLAEQLIESSTAEFDTAQFVDRYQDSLKQVIAARIKGIEPDMPEEEQPAPVISLMDALKQSVAQAAKKKPPAESVKTPAKQARRKRA